MTLQEKVHNISNINDITNIFGFKKFWFLENLKSILARN